MNLRWKLAIAAMMLMPAVVGAQGVVLAPVGAADPYAMAPTSTNPYLWGNGLAFPSTNTLFRDRFWVSLDYLLWWPEGMDSPPLVTTSSSGTAPGAAGVLGQTNTGVLFGGNQLNDGSANGVRLRTGWWFRQGAWALESEFLRLNSSGDSFAASGDGNPILARPYLNIVNGQQVSRLVSFPGITTGTVSATSDSTLESALLNVRASLIPLSSLGFSDGCDPPDRVDWIIGYRGMKLDDDLSIVDIRNAVLAADPDSQTSSDSFSTSNRFNGLQLGAIYQLHFQRVWMESMIRVALGNNQRSATILGATTITDNGTSTPYNGGLLALNSNIGNYSESEFTMIPEIGFNFGIRATRCLHFTLGYNLLYFPNVWRASEQIDLDINPGLIPPQANNVAGALRPQFRAIENDYWASGLNFGAQLKF